MILLDRDDAARLLRIMARDCRGMTDDERAELRTQADIAQHAPHLMEQCDADCECRADVAS